MDINMLKCLKRAIAGALWMLMTKGISERINLLGVFLCLFVRFFCREMGVGAGEVILKINFPFPTA